MDLEQLATCGKQQELWRSQPINVVDAHDELFCRVQDALANAFHSLHIALDELYVQEQKKLESIRLKQQLILQTNETSMVAMRDFTENARRIASSLEPFTAHAGNLANVKLTLVRSAKLVSQEGDLSKLVMEPKTVSSSFKKPSTTCFVFHLAHSIDDAALRELFSCCGTVLNASVYIDKKTNEHRGYGFVDYATEEEARCAVDTLHKSAYRGKQLSVSIKI